MRRKGGRRRRKRECEGRERLGIEEEPTKHTNDTKGKAMRIKSEHWNDANGNPEGGSSFGNGFAISWQHGPLGRGPNRREPNGAFVEDVILACVDRIQYYQANRFASAYNQKALEHLGAALDALDQRTKDREARAVEGTHED